MDTKEPTWANATAAGLVALAVACVGFFAVLNGHVSGASLRLFGAILLGGFVIQVITALVDLKQGNLAGGNTFTFFCAFFMLASGIEMFIKAAGGADARIDGWLWATLGVVLILWTPAFLKTPVILLGIVVSLDLAIPFVAIHNFVSVSNPDLSLVAGRIAGWILLVGGVMGAYLSSAMVVNGTFGKPIYPNPGPLYKAKGSAD